MQERIWLSSPHMGPEELSYVLEAFETNWIAPLGPNLTAFEAAIGDYLGGGVQVAGLSSGTAALHLGLELLGVGRGDTVLCQSFTFAASANPIVYLGAEPVFVDSESDTWNMDPHLLEAAIEAGIKSGKKPKAIVPVHLYGMPYKHDQIREIARHYDIPVLEDSAEALGSTYKGQACGTLGDIAILSFNGNKIITTSGGGALVTRNPEIKERAVFLATQARDNAPHYQHSAIGYNYRMSNVLAGIGRGQMQVLSERVKARQGNYKVYREALEDCSQVTFLEAPEGLVSNRWLTTILLPDLETREAVRLALWEENIESRPLWKPMHLQPVFSGAPAFANGTSETLFARGLCLPSGSNLTAEDLGRTLETLKKSLK
ncbi:aminotransferase class I/II-fold pyridoxal phosphate-dependent enzyme [Robiginitalea sp. M366]|uniref:DegT/DnrJ/EryC1/StrS family aminotransferase n=1 Tax=Robiginitalea aestuariiviva TaxID=3036903 RepID=UPI00240DC6B1|nr:aminotransferase class I/II-fold pyridoxal phosphate-dependent enzyme [Robiginitalea aestuariiviva]MDG1572743.1 aminotransferase class I/II-fold pyridoxal phosphate-dependent enzyme [Robiginitalea aestuariiviva]